jgi:hypothetical protein
MKHTKSSIIVFVCALFISIAVFGDITREVPKWSQLPDMAGYDWSSETIVPSAVADDWLCENGLPIDQITWWGSYYTPAVFPYKNSDNYPDPTIPSNTNPGTITGFYIAIFGNDTGCNPWPAPGELLYLTQVDIADVSETLYGVATKPGGQQENVWQYSVNLDKYFYQEQGQKYWLTIMAIDGGDWEPTSAAPIIQWGWHQTDKSKYGWGEDAVQLWQFDQNGDESENECMPWELLVDTEMAFELHSVPEPSTMMMIVSSLGLLALIVRKRSK